MKTSARAIAIAFAAGACFAPLGASAFESGSTGADGAFNPTVNTTVPLPPSGIFNYTSVNIPVGVTVTYQRNATNTPVVILASGNVTVAGTLNLGGAAAPASGTAGGGALGDDGTPGLGGPGGFNGGPGSKVSNGDGGHGLGPGGGERGGHQPGVRLNGGGGGGYGAVGAGSGCLATGFGGFGGEAYGSGLLLPLIGGSGGGGGSGGQFAGGGGGGGGGAVLIAASGTVTISGSILADGGNGGSSAGSQDFWQPAGGAGSGGAIRIVATTIAGDGTLRATGGAGGTSDGSWWSNCEFGGAGAVGRIRLEADNMTRNAGSNPIYIFGAPGPVFVAGTPTLRIATVAGIAAPAAPTGVADITLPSTTPNPVTVAFETTGVPQGNIVQFSVTPTDGAKIVVVSPALTGSTASATASVSVNLPSGPSVLQARTTYTVTAAVGDLLKNFAGNERVERVTLTATLGGPQKVMLTTVSGREFEAPAEVLRLAALGG